MAEALERFPRMGAVAYYKLDSFCAFRVNTYVEDLIAKEQRPAGARNGGGFLQALE